MRMAISVGPNDLDDEVIQRIGWFSEVVKWPIIADPASQIRGRVVSGTVITTGGVADLFLSRSRSGRRSCCPYWSSTYFKSI